MRFQRSAPPPVQPARLVENGPLTGAVERVWARWWSLLRG
jgi:hypothetical protein